MEITTTYIISQILVVFVYVFLGLTYCVKSRKIVLALSFSSNLLNGIAFILLGAYTSSIMCGISILRDIIFMIDQKINGKSSKITAKDIIILAFIYGISIISIIITFNGVLTLLYAAASMLYTYSIWQKNNKIYRMLGIPTAFLSMCDSIYIKSLSGIIPQLVVLICSIVGYVSHKEENVVNSKDIDENYLPKIDEKCFNYIKSLEIEKMEEYT